MSNQLENEVFSWLFGDSSVVFGVYGFFQNNMPWKSQIHSNSRDKRQVSTRVSNIEKGQYEILVQSDGQSRMESHPKKHVSGDGNRGTRQADSDATTSVCTSAVLAAIPVLVLFPNYRFQELVIPFAVAVCCTVFRFTKNQHRRSTPNARL